MIQFLLDNWNVVLGIGLALLILFSGQISSGFNWAWSKLPAIGGGTKTTTVSADIDVTDLHALKIIQARFERLNCKQAKTAVAVLFDHFFHTEGHA